jgi:hypothetical protein
VLLVSRAVAILTMITALTELLTNLPYWVFTFSHLHESNPSTTMWFVYRVSFVRIALLFLIAALFWRCGPGIERLLLPAGTQERSDTPQ